MKTITKLWIALIVLCVLSPLGLLIPAKLSAGSAWGEWSADEVRELVGYVPARLAHLAELWKAPLPDYALPGQEEAALGGLSASYILSALLGVAVVVGVTLLLGRAVARRDRAHAA